MKKTLILAFLCFLFSNTSFAECYFFKECKISEAVIGNYVINLKENVIEVQLIREDGIVQNFSDKIKLIEKNKIVSEKIKSVKDSDLYYQYFLNSKSKSVIKLEYKKESVIDMEMFKLHEILKNKMINRDIFLINANSIVLPSKKAPSHWASKNHEKMGVFIAQKIIDFMN